MTTIPACPPRPTLEELQSDQFVEVDMNELVPNEFVVLRYRDRISCVEIMNNTNDPNGRIKYRYSSSYPGNISHHLKPYIYNVVQFYRKINHRKNFDDMTKKMEVRIRNYPINQQLTSAETIFANKGLSDNIGKFLGPSTSGKGGRRKRRGTRRTRKNKRKSTRRIRRK